jgi:hypothetical protein
VAVTRRGKKLAQTALSSAVTARYTSPANTATQVTEIYLTNTNTTTARKAGLYAHGTAGTNVLIPEIEIAANGAEVLSNLKIWLEAGEVLAAKQDDGTDVIMTAYGIQEVTS